MPAENLPARTHILVRYRYALLALAVILTALGWPAANRLQLDQSIESFYAPDDPRLADYRESRSIFGGDEFVVVAFRDPELLTAAGTLSAESSQRIEALAAALSEVPGVHPASTQNLADAMTLDRFPLLAAQREGLRKLYEGILLGSDQETTAVVVRLLPAHETSVPRADTIRAIRRIASSFSLPTYVAGEPVLVNETFEYVRQDGAVLGWVSTGLLCLVIALIFRRLRWILLPVLVVQTTIIWTKALLWISQLQLSMVSSIVNSLLTVVGVATVMHLIVRYRERSKELLPAEAASATIGDLGQAIFWTTATTAAGFGAQLTSHVTPVRSFGWMMACGTTLVLVASALILPGGTLFRAPRQLRPERERSDRTARILDALQRCRERYPLAVASGALLVVFLAFTGMLRLRVETDFSKNFRADTPIVEALNFVETRLGGGSVWEINFPAPEVLDQQYLDRVARVADQLRRLRLGDQPQLTKVVAYSDGLALVPLLPLPAKQLLLRQFQPEFENSLYQPEHGRMRIVLRARERQRAEDRQKIIDDVTSVARAEFPHVQVTGLFVLLTYLIESLLGDQWISLGVGAALIVTFMSVAFRSVVFGLIALIPNLFPILLVLGTMGWLDIPINLGTAMISSVSLGLTVDSSIHYFTGYFRARRSGQSFEDALRATHQEVGAALIYTNLALIAGFLVLTLSHFMPLVYFGMLVSAAMMGGLLGNLLLLPMLLHAARIGTRR